MLNADKLLHELEMQNAELLRANAALEISCDHYARLYNYAPIGYLTLTDENIICEINRTAATLLGVEREKIIDHCFADYVSPEDDERWQRNFLYARQSGEKQQCELTLRRANGSFFYAYLDYLYQEAAGDTSPMLQIMFTDITEQIQLRDCDEVYHSILATTLDGFWVFSSQGKLLDVNNRYADLSGYSRKELLSMTVTELEATETLGNTAVRIEHIIDTGGDQFESLHRRKDGSIWNVEVSVTFLDYYGGRFYAFLRDISKRKQAEEETKEINAALNVLLRQRETDKSNAQYVLSLQAEGTVLPFLNKLKKSSTDSDQSRLLNVLETNLQHLVKTYGRANTLSATYQLLTPVEIQVASMIRQGLSTKLIAATLHISQGTVSIHRKHIRKKLGLNGKASNLSSYLLSLAE